MKTHSLGSLSCLLAVLMACTPEPERSSPSSTVSSPTPQEFKAQPSASPTASEPVAKEAAQAGFLIVLGSWKASTPSALVKIPNTFLQASPFGVHFADGFPRAATEAEREALRPGYGALLGGICVEPTGANAAIQALNDQGTAAYLREYKGAQTGDCPEVNQHWALGQELIHVIEAGKPNIDAEVARLISLGADVNQGEASRTPLNLAAYANDISTVRALLKAGAHVNLKKRAPQENSTLELAIRTPNGDPFDLVRLLVSHGADVDAVTEGAEADPGSSPQIQAARRCRPQLLQFLQSKSRTQTTLSKDDVCRDRHPPEASADEQQAVLELLGSD